jgi:GNAT superfamily N-acetyltransferase
LSIRRSETRVVEVLVTTYYLQMTSRDQLRRRRSSRDGFKLELISPPKLELNRFFYATIGGGWNWVDRLPWTADDWLRYLMQPGIETWVLSVGGLPAGYFELDAQSDGDVEIVYFGLLQKFTGMGLGGHLLTCAVERAWGLGAQRVWLHTCSLDDPRALSHYLARGFELYHQEDSEKELSVSSRSP